MLLLVQQDLITSANRPGRKLIPCGLVIHSTATPGAPADNIRAYFQNHPEARSSAHYAADWDRVIQIIPDNEMAWHAGAIANSQYLSIELCEPKTDDPAKAQKFQKVWNTAIEFTVNKCRQYGWSTANLYSHADISRIYRQTDHTDPLGYFKQYGRSWSEFTATVEQGLKGGDSLTVDQALQILVQKGIINSPEYWRNAVDVVKNLDALLIKMAGKIE